MYKCVEVNGGNIIGVISEIRGGLLTHIVPTGRGIIIYSTFNLYDVPKGRREEFNSSRGSRGSRGSGGSGSSGSSKGSRHSIGSMKG